jgi:nucleotide exchange factor SIL1
VDENNVDVKARYRDIDQLKKDFDAINLNIKSNSDIMIELFEQLKNSSLSKEDKITVLNEIEYHVHFFDNGVLLCDIGAFWHILNDLNSTKTDLDVMVKSVVVLGAAVQG